VKALTRHLPSLPNPVRFALVVLAAAALNLIPIVLLGDSRVLLGPFLTMPLVLALPRPWALVAAVVPAAVTVVTLNHPFLVILGAAEALWLAQARADRPGRVFLRAVLFWVVVGAPIGIWLYYGIAGLPAEIVAIWLCSRAINQIAAVLVGYSLLHHSPLYAWTQPARASRSALRAYVFNYVVVLAAVPLALTGLGFSAVLNWESHEENAEQLGSISDRVSHELNVFLKLHQAAIQAIANIAQRDPEGVNLFLVEQHRAHPDFITMLMADRGGRIVATAPAEALTRLYGNDVSDRAYFNGARDSLEPQISGVFRGRGFGNDLLIGVSVPVLTPGGEFDGIVQGSVEIGRFARIATSSARSVDVEFILFDRSGNVVYSSDNVPLRPLDSVLGLPIQALQNEPTGRSGITYDGKTGSRFRRFRAYATTDPETGITVVVQRPLLAPLSNAGWIYGLLSVIFAGVVATAAVVARLARRRLSDPLEHFAGSAAEQATNQQLAPITPPAAPDELPQEVALVFVSFNRLVERLQQTLEELRRSNAELDQRVALRTRELEEARRTAESASASKTRFLAMTSHEIRTPLNAIIGFADSLVESVRDPFVADRLRTIRSSGVLLLGVVNDLLDLSSVEAGRIELRPAPCDVDLLCRDLGKLFAHPAEQKGLRLSLDLDAAEPRYVVADSQRLQQVLTNLLANAVKFTIAGRVSLRVEKQPVDAGQVRLTFSVTDTGPGIPAERQARMFEEFYRVEELRDTPGTGLGLNISRRLVELMGGTIQFESVVGVGTRFWFSITVEPVSSVPTPAAPPVASKTEELRILVVDDHPANQEVMRALLEDRCAHLEVVGSAQEALALLAAQSFDVALIDLEMPGFDGFQLVQRIRQGLTTEVQHCRLIAVSAHAQSQMRDRCRAAGFDDYLEKPIERRLLWQVLRPLPTTLARDSAPGSRGA
jgi:two-component system, sensor histidine kinase